MNAFVIFNLIAWLVVIFLVVIGASGELGALCYGLLAGGALIALDVIWLIVLAMIRLGRGPKRGDQGPSEAPVDPNLVRYLKEARARGLGDGEIEPRLAQNGWSASEIQRARKVARS